MKEKVIENLPRTLMTLRAIFGSNKLGVGRHHGLAVLAAPTPPSECSVDLAKTHLRQSQSLPCAAIGRRGDGQCVVLVGAQPVSLQMPKVDRGGTQGRPPLRSEGEGRGGEGLTQGGDAPEGGPLPP